MNNRLYRSTSDAMLGGVSAGIARYLNIDPVLVRIGFVLGTFLTGWLFFVYLALWLVLPAPGSTAGDVGQIMRENVNEFTGRLRPEQSGGQPNQGTGVPNQAAPVQAVQGTVQSRQGLSASSFAWVLILIGGFFLLHALHITNWRMWPAFWPALLIVGGIWLLRRNRA